MPRGAKSSRTRIDLLGLDHRVVHVRCGFWHPPYRSHWGTQPSDTRRESIAHSVAVAHAIAHGNGAARVSTSDNRSRDRSHSTRSNRRGACSAISSPCRPGTQSGRVDHVRRGGCDAGYWPVGRDQSRCRTMFDLGMREVHVWGSDLCGCGCLGWKCGGERCLSREGIHRQVGAQVETRIDWR
jgi:hypothetical protein